MIDMQKYDEAERHFQRILQQNLAKNVWALVMLSKDLMKLSMRDCTENVYVLPDQRKTNHWSTKKKKNEEEKECYIR